MEHKTIRKIEINGDELTFEEFIQVCLKRYTVNLSELAARKIVHSRSIIEEMLVNSQTIYGVTTGFGYQCKNEVPEADRKKLQNNLIVSHAVGVGEPLETEVVRGIMFLLVNSLAKGYSGVRLILVETIIQMLNKGVHPIVPKKGSLGSSGDLVPMSHLILPLIGLGIAEYKGVKLNGREAMQKAGIELIRLEEKEGLSCINGTYAMTSLGIIILYNALNVLKVADMAAALTFEALRGIANIFQERVHMLRPHQGQLDTAHNMRLLLENSGMVYTDLWVKNQDAYSLRCIPQVHGASKDSYNFALHTLIIEMNAVNDNPVIFEDTKDIVTSGNFHGQPIALCLDFLCMALSEIANISERRIERLVNPSLSNGLPGFLIRNNRINSGFMIVQYVAAALVSENKILSHPACVDSIPTSANQEDHVSMGMISANKASEVLKNTRNVIAMELLCSCQGIDLRGDKMLGKGTRAAYAQIRKFVSYLEEDQEMSQAIGVCEQLIVRGDLIACVEQVVGTLII